MVVQEHENKHDNHLDSRLMLAHTQRVHDGATRIAQHQPAPYPGPTENSNQH